MKTDLLDQFDRSYKGAIETPKETSERRSSWTALKQMSIPIFKYELGIPESASFNLIQRVADDRDFRELMLQMIVAAEINYIQEEHNSKLKPAQSKTQPNPNSPWASCGLPKSNKGSE